MLTIVLAIISLLIYQVDMISGLVCAGVIIFLIAPMDMLYVLYAAVMNFKRAKDDGILSKAAYILGMPYYILGMLLDIYCNTIPVTILFFEFPKLVEQEFTVTARMTRLSQIGGRRGDIARWFCEDLLNCLDPSGKHCK